MAPAPSLARGVRRRRPHGLHTVPMARPDSPRAGALAIPRRSSHRPRPGRVDGGPVSLWRTDALDTVAGRTGRRDRHVAAGAVDLANGPARLDSLPSFESGAAA